MSRDFNLRQGGSCAELRESVDLKRGQPVPEPAFQSVGSHYSKGKGGAVEPQVLGAARCQPPHCRSLRRNHPPTQNLYCGLEREGLLRFIRLHMALFHIVFGMFEVTIFKSPRLPTTGTLPIAYKQNDCLHIYRRLKGPHTYLTTFSFNLTFALTSARQVQKSRAPIFSGHNVICARSTGA